MNNWEITTPEEISSLSLDVLTEKMLRKKRQAKEMSVEEEQVEEKQEVNQTPVAEKQKVDQMRTEEAKTAAAQEEQAFKQYTLAKGDTVWGELREDKGQEGATDLVRNYEETASERLVDAGAFETQNEAKKYLDYSFRRMAIGAGFEASPEQIRVEDFFSPEKIEQYKQKKQSRKDYVLGEDIVKKLEESGDLPKTETELPEKYLNAKGEERSIDSVVANELGYIPESMGGKGPQLTEEQKKEAAKVASRERLKMKKEAVEGKSGGEKAAEFLVGGIQAYREAGEAAVKSKEGDEKLTQLEKEIDTIRKEYKGADLEKKNQLEKDYLRLSAKKAEVLGEWEVANTYLAKMSDKQALGLSLGAASNIGMFAPVATAGSTAAKAAQGATGRVLGRQIAKGVAGAAAEGAIGGAGESAAAAMAQDASTEEIAKSAAVGGVIGTGLGVTLGAGGALTGKLVKKFKKGVPDEAAEAIASKANAKAEEMRAEGASNQEITEEVERVIKETDPERAKLLEAKRKGDRKKVVELAEKTDKIDEKETLQRLKKDAQKDPEARKAVAERVFGEEPKPDPKKEAIQRVLTDEPLTPEGKKRFEAEGLEPDEETIKQLVETNPEKAKRLLNEETYQKYTTEAPQAGKQAPKTPRSGEELIKGLDDKNQDAFDMAQELPDTPERNALIAQLRDTFGKEDKRGWFDQMAEYIESTRGGKPMKLKGDFDEYLQKELSKKGVGNEGFLTEAGKKYFKEDPFLEPNEETLLKMYNSGKVKNEEFFTKEALESFNKTGKLPAQGATPEQATKQPKGELDLAQEAKPKVETKQPTTKTKPFKPEPTDRIRTIEGTGKTKTRGLSKGIEEKAIEKGIAESLGDLPGYKSINRKEQASKASKLLREDPDKALRIAMGEETAPAGVLPESVLIAVEKKADDIDDVDTLMKLANRSELMGESTTMGQRISMLAERSPESSVVAMKKVRNERIKQLEKRVESLEGQLKNSKKSIKRTLKREQPKKSDWEAFVDEIKC